MANGTFEGVKITGLACAVPKNTEYIRDYADRFDVDKFIATVGIEQRHIAGELQSSSDLCYEAAKKLIAYKGYDKDSFDGIILVTETPDYDTPATSHILQYRLGLPKSCMAFDINLGCSGFVYGLGVVASMVKSGALKRAILCCGHANPSLFPDDDPATSLLFADAGCAVIIEKGDDNIHTLLKADGSGYKMLMTPGIRARVKVDFDHLEYRRICHRMDGVAVFEFALRQVPKLFSEFFDTFGGCIDDYDYGILHQANLFMTEHIRRKIRLPKEKTPISIDRYGNTDSVSIPLTIADLCQNSKTPDTMRMIAAGFGIGLSYGIADFSLDRKDILPVIETDAYYHEAFRG